MSAPQRRAQAECSPYLYGRADPRARPIAPQLVAGARTQHGEGGAGQPVAPGGHRRGRRRRRLLHHSLPGQRRHRAAEGRAGQDAQKRRARHAWVNGAGKGRTSGCTFSCSQVLYNLCTSDELLASSRCCLSFVGRHVDFIIRWARLPHSLQTVHPHRRCRTGSRPSSARPAQTH